MQLIAKLLNQPRQPVLPTLPFMQGRLESSPSNDQGQALSAKSDGRSCHFHFCFKNGLLALNGSLLIGGMLSEPAIAQQTSPVANVTLSPKFSPNPVELRGIGGGSVAVKAVAGQSETQTGMCNGFVDTEPDHTVVLKTFFSYLSLKVQSPQDTTLVIKGPGGIWCNDDHEGKNPGIAGEWLAGTYQIWIGSYDKTNYVPYILKITEAR